MASNLDVEEFDEDCVFNKLVTAEKKPHRLSKSERMERIFAQATTTETDIQVSDFLPVY